MIFLHSVFFRREEVSEMEKLGKVSVMNEMNAMHEIMNGISVFHVNENIMLLRIQYAPSNGSFTGIACLYNIYMCIYIYLYIHMIYIYSV